MTNTPAIEPSDPEIWVGKDEDGIWQAVIDVPPFGSPPMQFGSGYVQLGTGEDIGDPRDLPGWVRMTRESVVAQGDEPR